MKNKLVHAIASGSLLALHQVNKPMVNFLELTQSDEEPGIYRDANGLAYTEAEKDSLYREMKRHAEMCFMEIKSY